MRLTAEEKEILDGKQGVIKQKILRSVISYGEIFGATELADITHGGHFVVSMGAGVIRPYYEMLENFIKNDIKPRYPFTMDPRPNDPKTFKMGVMGRLGSKIVYKYQSKLESLYEGLGWKGDDYFSCACYLPEMDNTPRYGDILAWSESSAVVYVNSVIGARTNRTAGGIDVLMNVIGKTPKFGLLTDEGRKSPWIVKLDLDTLPNAQLLGSAIGMKVMGDNPYIIGLNELLGDSLTGEVKSYLKDMGAAMASNGAVGLYHIEGLTPEAKKYGRELILENANEYRIDADELKRVYRNYPNIWKKKDAAPEMCFIGCPHLTYEQLVEWAHTLCSQEIDRLKVQTYLLSAPPIIKKFKKEHSALYEDLRKKGADISYICPLMFMANPVYAFKPIITNSNKLRTYTGARFFTEKALLSILKTGRIPEVIEPHIEYIKQGGL